MILPATAPAFFMRDRPISSIANPACMNNTRMAASTTHIWLAENATSWICVANSAGVGSAAKADTGNATSANIAKAMMRRNTPVRMISP